MASPRRPTLQHSVSWTRIRVQLSGGLLCGVVVPFSTAALWSSRLIEQPVVVASAWASVVAIVSGFYVFRSLIGFPGIRAGNYILPTFSSTYAAAAVLLLLLRLGYSRPLLFSSYMLCLGWFFFVYFRIQQAKLTIGIVPFGETASLRQIRNVNWIMLTDPQIAAANQDAIAADFHWDLPDEWERFLADAALSGIAVFHVRQLRESLTGRVEIQRLSENAYGALLPSQAYQTGKAVLDVLAAIVLLLPVLMLFLVIGAVIKLDSTGPVFFRQIRIGYRGRPFSMWKFRTMIHHSTVAEPVRDDAITVNNDARITRVGRVLRRSRLDELPQVINILAGQMSWIGPRPEAQVLSRWYERELPFYRYRHVVLPGITGWGQVNQGHVANVEDVLEKLHYDFFYISNFSAWLDLLIIMRTVKTMLTGFGSR